MDFDELDASERRSFLTQVSRVNRSCPIEVAPLDVPIRCRPLVNVHDPARYPTLQLVLTQYACVCVCDLDTDHKMVRPSDVTANQRESSALDPL